MAGSIHALLDDATVAVAALHDLDLDEVVPSELSAAVVRLHALRSAMDAAEAKVLARWDSSKEWRISGAKTPAAWLAWRERIPIGVARQRMRHARAVRDLPAIGDAWADGEIDRSHVTTLLDKRTARTRESFDRDHKELLDDARTRRFTEFRSACDRWELVHDPDGADQSAAGDHDAREVFLSQSFGGMWFGKMTFDPVSGEIVNATLALIETELFDADWADAKTRLGREPTVLELHRTPAQRRADAMVEMAIRARTAPAGGRRPAPLFTVVVGYETLTGPVLELFNRTMLSPRVAARWLSQADVERIVFDSPSRVVDVGARRRFFRGALRRAIEVRDRTCFHPSCDEPPERPHIDHIEEASRGGPTTQRNGRLGCAFHNLWRVTHPDETWNEGTPDVGDPDAGPDPPVP